MFACLTALPPELFSCVVANIASPPTLCNLARCSRQLYLCTIPHLYRHVTIHEKVVLPPERQNRRLKTLAVLLIRRPDLAGLVRHFTFCVAELSRGRGYHDELNEPEDWEGSELVKVNGAFSTTADASSLSKEEKINCLGQISPVHESHYDLVLALLLPALLKVEILVLDLDIVCNTYYFEHMMRRAACREKPFDSQPSFQALRVFAHSHNRFYSRSTNFFASLLKLPAIEEISGGFEDSLNGEDDSLRKDFPSGQDLKDLDSSSSPLTSLDLSVYVLSSTNLGNIFRAPKALKTLVYKLRRPYSLAFTEICHALKPQINYLESLHLDCDPARRNNSEVTSPMPSFISFKTLKVFKTASKFLRHQSLIDIFPPSLETLHLTRFRVCIHGLLETLKHLLAQKSPRQIPSLKRIILDETKPFDPLLDPRFGTRPPKMMTKLRRTTRCPDIVRLRRLAAAQGVSIDIAYESTDKASVVEEL